MSVKRLSDLVLSKKVHAPTRGVDRENADWVRNQSWRALPAVSATEQKFVGLHAVWSNSNFAALSASGDYTVDWGDGTVENFASGATAQHEYLFSDADLSNTNAPVTFTDAGDLVGRTAHGYTDGMKISFASVTTTTGIVAGQIYYVVNATTNDFQLASTPAGTPLTLTGDGSGFILPYKQAIVVVTPQVGHNLTSLSLSVKHNQSGLQQYSTGWLDITISGRNLTSLVVANTSQNVRHKFLARASLISTNLIADMSGMFMGCSSLESVPLFDTASATNMSSMFSECTALTTAPMLDTAAVTNMYNMFASCLNLTSVPLLNTSSVTNMGFMFVSCKSLVNIPLFDTSSATSVRGMFSNCLSLVNIPLFDTSLVTDMSSMFQTCRNLATVPLFNTAAVTNMSSMFSNCTSITTVPLFNTAAVTDMTSMFYACPSITTVPLFNTAAVTNMASMFNNCTSLTTVPLFNTAAVRDMTSMFASCSALTDIPLFNTAAVTNMSSMFISCTRLTTVPLLNTAAVTNMSAMFANCTALTDIPAFNTAAVTSMGAFLDLCSQLSSIGITGTKTSFGVVYGKLSAAKLNELYTNLGVGTGKTITVTGNYGTSSDNPAIATAKGWTVTG